MWIGRNLDGTVYGVFVNKQADDEFHLRMEEAPESHPDIVAFRNRVHPVRIDPRDTKITELETRLAALERLRL